MYNRPLSASNFGAGVDNSYPVAHDLAQVVDEDNCTRLADLANAATDWDNEGLGRQQTLTASLDGLPSTGTLHADSRCSDAPLDQASAANLLLRDPALGHDVYFLPPPNEYSIGGSHRAPNVALPWSIDGVPMLMAPTHYIHTHVHAYICAYIQTCIHTYVHAYISHVPTLMVPIHD